VLSGLAAAKSSTNPHQSWPDEKNAHKANANQRIEGLQRAGQSIRENPLEQPKGDAYEQACLCGVLLGQSVKLTVVAIPGGLHPNPRAQHPTILFRRVREV
jgi:hypothetical protein